MPWFFAILLAGQVAYVQSLVAMSYAFVDIHIGNAPSSRIVIELFHKDAPETCQFFKSLLTGANGYKGTRFTRVIDDFMIQGGDVALERTDATLPQDMENTDFKVDAAGLVGLARTNVAELNSQFFITLVPSEHLNGKHSIFGRVVKGMDVVHKIGGVEIDDNDVPLRSNEVVIVTCGELQPRRRESAPANDSTSRRSQPARERSRSLSPRGVHREKATRERSPRRADKAERKPSPSANGQGDRPQDDRHRHRHHHHRHKSDRHSRSHGEHSERREKQDGSRTKERSRSPERSTVPTAPRDYRPRGDYPRESNYGRLGYDVGYDDDVRDDEYHIRQVERQRERDRGHEEPKVVFKGRGVMKFRERW
jgi:cyclophilin family peptidyl-prolyl cis-trans isomerase